MHTFVNNFNDYQKKLVYNSNVYSVSASDFFHKRIIPELTFWYMSFLKAFNMHANWKLIEKDDLQILTPTNVLELIDNEY